MTLTLTIRRIYLGDVAGAPATSLLRGRAMAKPSQRRNLRAAYEKSRSVDPRPITGREKPADLLAHAFGAYVGRQERTAFELMQRSVAEDCSIFLTLSGAMTPAGLHQSCLIPLVERG